MKVEDKPLISVIIPVYGNEQYIERCLGSIVSQTYNNLEIIAVNGCTQNCTTTLLKEKNATVVIKNYHSENAY